MPTKKQLEALMLYILLEWPKTKKYRSSVKKN